MIICSIFISNYIVKKLNLLFSEKINISNEKYYTMSLLILGGVIVGLIAAPVIAPAFAIIGLTGAAATSSGLAFLGGGSLAAGGLGMLGGTAVVGASGGILGTIASMLI